MYSAKIILDSINVCGNRITTFELQYPRFIHSEVMTHREHSKNAASSRAIPAKKMRENILNDPALPLWWGKNEKGMQAFEEVDETTKKIIQHKWLTALQLMAEVHKDLEGLDLHKQITNRLLEPWMFMTVIMTATSYKNYFLLRNHRSAQPEIQWLAKEMQEIYDASSPTLLQEGEWHLPYIYKEDKEAMLSKCLGDQTLANDLINRISAGRCARVSYLTHDGKRDLQADLDLYTRLVGGPDQLPHCSPLEHPAMALNMPERWGNFTGWKQLRKFIEKEYNGSEIRR